MEKKTLTFVAVLFLAGLCCSEAFALSPIGTPTAGLPQGRVSLGAEYSQSELGIDFEFSDGTAPLAGSPESAVSCEIGTTSAI